MRVRLRFHHARRGSPSTLCLLPGWGFDHRIFDPVSWPCDTLAVEGGANGRDIAGPLLEFLDAHAIRHVSLFGWSLGALRALRLASELPERVERLLLASLRPRFPPEEIALQRAELSADPVQAMRRFYRRALAGQKRDAEWFGRELEEPLLAALDVAALQAGLDELAASDVQPEELSLEGRGASLLAGARDLVAPVAEIETLAASSSARLTLLPGVGHAPFLSELFPAWLAGELARPIDR